MLWTNKRVVNGFDGGFHTEWDIHITRGDTGYLELIPKRDGKTYQLASGDVVAVEVRVKPITGSTVTELVFAGSVDTSESVPVWHLTAADTTRECGVYFWDAQMTTSDGEVASYLTGRLFIEPEVTR